MYDLLSLLLFCVLQSTFNFKTLKSKYINRSRPLLNSSRQKKCIFEIQGRLLLEEIRYLLTEGSKDVYFRKIWINSDDLIKSWPLECSRNSTSSISLWKDCTKMENSSDVNGLSPFSPKKYFIKNVFSDKFSSTILFFSSPNWQNFENSSLTMVPLSV